MLLFLLSLLALFSVADQSGLAWLGLRSALFLAAGLVAVRSRSGPHLPSLALALGLVAAGGYRALDYSLAALLFGAFAGAVPTRRRWWSNAAIGTGLVGCIALIFHHWGSALLPKQLPVADFAVLFPFRNRNHFAIFAEIFLPLLIWQCRRGPLLPYAAGAALLVLGSLAGGSRAGVLILGLELLVLAWRYGGRKALLPAAIGAAALASVFVLLSDPARIRSPLEGDHRLEIWQSSVGMIAARPVAGWGAEEFARVYPSYAIFDNGQRVLNAHCDWLEWAVEFGLAAPLFLALLLGAYLRKVQRHPWAWGILFGALHAFVDFGWHMPGLMLFTAAFAGAAVRHVEEPTNP
jgi:O-antigen ligase